MICYLDVCPLTLDVVGVEVGVVFVHVVLVVIDPPGDDSLVSID